MEICVSGECARRDTENQTGRRCMKCASRRQRRGSKESSRKRVPPCCIRETGAKETSRLLEALV